MTQATNIEKIRANVNAQRDPVLGVGSMAAMHAVTEANEFVNEVHNALKARIVRYAEAGVAANSAKVKSTQKAIAAFTTAPAQDAPAPAPEPAPAVTKSQVNRLRKDDLVALVMQMLNADA